MILTAFSGSSNSQLKSGSLEQATDFINSNTDKLAATAGAADMKTDNRDKIPNSRTV
jgi:hypothetical protein